MAGQALSGMMLPAVTAMMMMKPELFGVNPNLLGRKPKDQGIVGRPSPNILERMGLPTSTKTTVDPRNQGILYNPLLMR